MTTRRADEAGTTIPAMQPIETVQGTIALIDAHEGRPEDFSLPVSEALLDPLGMAMR